jgi:hypothetical protein
MARILRLKPLIAWLFRSGGVKYAALFTELVVLAAAASILHRGEHVLLLRPLLGGDDRHHRRLRGQAAHDDRGYRYFQRLMNYGRRRVDVIGV